MRPNETSPTKVAELFRQYAEEWQKAAADPMDRFEDNPMYSDCCEKVATIMFEMADRLEKWIDADLLRRGEEE